jgi:hypothetical protein
MKRFGAPPAIALACLCLATVLLPAAAPAAVHAHLSTLTVSDSALPQAQAGLFHHKSVDFGASVDSFGGATPTDARGWYDIRIDNLGQTPVPQPTVSIDGATANFTPPYTGGFPAGVTNAGDLEPGQELRLNTFGCCDQNTPHENLTGVQTGADVSRSSTVTPDGTVLTETVTATLTDPGLAGGGVQIEVDPFNPGQQANAATLDLAHMVLPDMSNGEFQFQPGAVAPGEFKWAINGGIVGKHYTLTIPIDLNGVPAATYKPHVNFGISPAPNSASATANSTTIPSASLGGNVTFAAATGALVAWQTQTAELPFVDIGLAGSSVPQAQALVDHHLSTYIRAGNADSISATTPLAMTGDWQARLNNFGQTPIPIPSISLNGATATVTPPYTGGFPAVATAPGDLQPGQELDLNTFRCQGPSSPCQQVTGAQTGFDASRSGSVGAGGSVLTETVSVTLQSQMYAGGAFDIRISPTDQGQPAVQATLDTADATLPDTGDGEQPQNLNTPPGTFDWAISRVVVGKTYTLTLPINLNGLSGGSYQPNVSIFVNTPSSPVSTSGASTSIQDADLGGTFTFSAANNTAVDWQTVRTFGMGVTFGAQGSPQASAEVGENVDVNLPPTADSLSASTPISAQRIWHALIFNTGLTPVPAPTISLDGETALLTPPYTGSFPVAVTAPGDLQQGQRLELNTLGGGPFGSPVQNLPAYQTGFDASRTGSVNTDGTVVTERVAVTLRDASYAGGAIEIRVWPQNPSQPPNGATIDAAGVTLPDMTNGELQTPDNAPPGSFGWAIAGAVVGKTYILAVPIQLNGIPAASYKPYVLVVPGLPLPQGSLSVGPSVAIQNADLGGTFTFSAANGTDVGWGANTHHQVFLTFPSQGEYVLSLSPSSATIAAGDTVQAQLTLANPSWTGHTGVFLQQLNADGTTSQPPQGVFIQNQGSVQFSGPGTQPLTINTNPSTPQGTYNLVVVSNDGTNTQAPFTLTVGPPLPQVGFGFGSFTEFVQDSSIDAVGATDQLTGNETWNAGLNVFGTVGVPQAQITLPDGRHDLSPPVPYPLAVGPTNLSPGDGLDLPVSVADSDQPSTISVTESPQIAVQRSSSSGSWTLPAGGGVETVTVRVTPTQPGDDLQIHIVARDDNGNFWGTIEAANVVAPPGDNVSVHDGRLDWQASTPQANVTRTFVVPIDVPTGGTFKPVVNVQEGSTLGGSDGVGSSATLTDPSLGGTVTFSWGGRAHWNSNLNAGRGVFLAPVAQSVVASVATTLNVTVLGVNGAPAGGAFVQACAAGLFGCHTAAADANGTATITGDVPTGTGPLQITLTGSAADASGVDGPFTVTPGDTASRTLNLHSLAAPPADVTITELGTTSTGAPLVPIHQAVQLAADGCANGSATYAITRGSIQLAAGSLTESPAGSGQYSASGISIPFASGSGPATVSISIVCPSPTDNRPISFDVVYVDPSGIVETTAGVPIPGATVTLYRSATGVPGSFVAVPNGSTMLSPDNRTNPDTADAAGTFGWNVVPGFYYVHASAPGCTPADGPVSEVPPPVTGIVLKLACNTPPSPEAALAIDPSTQTLVVSGIGAAIVSATPLDKGTTRYVLAGGSGQVLTLVLKSTAQGQTIDAQVVSLQVANGPVQMQKTTLHYDWSLNGNGTIKQLHQDLQVGSGQAKEHVNAQFDGAKNQTALDAGGSGHSTSPGLVILKIVTSSGVLRIQH